MKISPSLPFDVWQCPNCDYIISVTEMQLAKYDVCYRCGCPLTKFVLCPATTDDTESQKETR